MGPVGMDRDTTQRYGKGNMEWLSVCESSNILKNFLHPHSQLTFKNIGGHLVCYYALFLSCSRSLSLRKQ